MDAGTPDRARAVAGEQVKYVTGTLLLALKKCYLRLRIVRIGGPHKPGGSTHWTHLLAVPCLVLLPKLLAQGRPRGPLPLWAPQ